MKPPSAVLQSRRRRFLSNTLMINHHLQYNDMTTVVNMQIVFPALRGLHSFLSALCCVGIPICTFSTPLRRRERKFDFSVYFQMILFVLNLTIKSDSKPKQINWKFKQIQQTRRRRHSLTHSLTHSTIHSPTHSRMHAHKDTHTRARTYARDQTTLTSSPTQNTHKVKQ